MTVELKLEQIDVNRVMEIVRELRAEGYIQGMDFDFAYRPSDWGNGFAMTPIRERHTLFTFYNERLATWFALKYIA